MFHRLHDAKELSSIIRRTGAVAIFRCRLLAVFVALGCESVSPSPSDLDYSEVEPRDVREWTGGQSGRRADSVRLLPASFGPDDAGYRPDLLGIVPAAQAGKPEVATVAIDEDGSLDATWDSDGKRIDDLAQVEEKFLAAQYYTWGLETGLGAVGGGYLTSPADTRAILARYAANGALDPDFDGNGLLAIDISGGDNSAVALAVENNKMFVAMFSQTGGEQQFGFARVSWSTGALDNSCDGNGTFGTTFPGYDGAVPRGVAVEPSLSRFVIAGCVYDGVGGCDHPAIAIYAVDDCSLLYQEVVSDYDGEFHAVTYDASVANPVIFAAGNDYSDPADTHILVARFDRDGELEPGFGGDGVVTVDIASSTHEFALDVEFQSSRLYVAGTGHYGGQSRMQFTKHLATTGALDTNCSGDGIVNGVTFSGDGAAAFSAVHDGVNLYLHGTNYYGEAGDFESDHAVAAFTSNCSLDSGFDGNGLKLVDVAGVDEAGAVASVSLGGDIRLVGWGIDY